MKAKLVSKAYRERQSNWDDLSSDLLKDRWKPAYADMTTITISIMTKVLVF